MNSPVFESNGLITTLKIMLGHKCTSADMSTRQVHTLQQQQQRFFIFRLTPMKCPHLLSHEMTGQVDSSALDQFLSSPHVVSYPAVVSSCSAELCSVLGKDGLRYRLRTPCNSDHSVFIEQHSNKRTTYHSATELVSRHTSHTAHEEIGTTFNIGLSKTSRVQFASGNTLHTSLANCYTSWMFMSSQAGLICILKESVKKSGLSVSDDHLSVGSTVDELFCVILPRSSTPWCDPTCKQRSNSDAKASLQTSASLTNRDRLTVTSEFRLNTVAA